MKITSVRAHHVRIPYDAGPALFRFGAPAQSALDTILVEVSTDAGITGWGDAFGYASPKTTAMAVAEMIAPQAVGHDVPIAAGIPAFMERVQRSLHIFGRYGITMFAISGLDIALWDIAAKARGLPLHRVLCERLPGAGLPGVQLRTRIPAYASLLKIGDADRVAEQSEDMNCPMDEATAIAFAHDCRVAAPRWLEEPVWPPEDFAALASVRVKGGLDIAAGENACTVHQFRQMLAAGAVSYAQPSVIKVGGITEYLKVAALADEKGVRLAPHSPYFGPGFLATLHLLSLRDDGSFVEVFYMQREACLWRGRIEPDANGTITVPDGPGLGYEPDKEVMLRYRVP
jgi:L-alanine-DL-glutamate epimerase-like enolase superfamily enzyme